MKTNIDISELLDCELATDDNVNNCECETFSDDEDYDVCSERPRLRPKRRKTVS